MKIIKTNDLARLGSVYQKIADKYGKDIPVMKSLSGDQDNKSVHINFRIHGQIAAQAEQLALKSDKINNKSEVHRAAHYMGTMILCKMLQDGNFKCSDIYENLLECEDLDHDYQILDDVTRTFKKIYNAHRANIIDTKQANSRVEDRVAILPENIRDLARQKANLIFEGRKMSEVLYEKMPGRPFVIKG